MADIMTALRPFSTTRLVHSFGPSFSGASSSAPLDVDEELMRDAKDLELYRWTTVLASDLSLFVERAAPGCMAGLISKPGIHWGVPSY